MRMIGHVSGEATARKFSDYLFAEGIENQVEAEKEGAWAVWIHAEENLDKARELLKSFLENPDDPRVRKSTKTAQDLREQKQRDQEAYEKRLKSRRHLFRPLSEYGAGPLSLVLVCISVVVFLLTNFGPRDPITNASKVSNALKISEFDSTRRGVDRMVGRVLEGLPEVKRGEVWRLVTPILLHFDILHILFNMMWLMDLGSMIEGRQNSLTFAALVLGLAVISNFAQYVVSGPDFGGMSGVVYGLLGYIWIRGKRDPGSGLYVQPFTVNFMIIWFFLGFTGFINMANTAHGAGLVAGMIWGYLSSLRFR